MKLVKRGDKGPEVMALQAVLNAQGITGQNVMLPLEIDGVFGTETEVAVQKAQSRARAYGADIEIDGICGPDTWGTLITERG